MSIVRLIIDVEGEVPTQPGGHYFYSLPHGRNKGGKQIVLRDTDIVQAVRLRPSRSADYYRGELKRYQKILVQRRAENAEQERIDRLVSHIDALEAALREAEIADGKVLRERYRYGIVFHNDAPDDLHRGPMTYDEANDWMNGWYEICDNEGGNRDAFRIVRQPVGEWDYEG